jgi:hypothetical protein
LPNVWRGGGWGYEAHVDRGPAMVLHEDEWRRRTRLYAHKRAAMRGFVPFLTIAVLLVTMNRGYPVWPSLQLLAIGAVLYLLGLIPYALRAWLHKPPPGLYAYGIELPWGRFVPYEEILNVIRRKRYTGICLNPGRRWWWLDYGLYGEAGAQYLMAIMGQRAGLPIGGSMPRLVVYGERGKE